MRAPHSYLSPHRRARIMLWALVVLAWLWRALAADAPIARRHRRRRFGWFDLGGMARLVRNLAIIRAGELAGLRPGRHRRFDPRRRRVSSWLRKAGGARLRWALKSRDSRRRIALLQGALKDLDTFALRHLGKRLRVGLRLSPIAAARWRNLYGESQSVRTPAPADTS